MTSTVSRQYSLRMESRFRTTLISDLQTYSWAKFRADLMAGLTVAIMLIPQGIAYSVLAGLPAIYGLYAGFIPLLVYPFFGSSRQLSVGPVALVSIMILTGLSPHAVPGSPEFVDLAILTALVAGLVQVSLAILRMGFLITFLSQPVIAGFTAAAALMIALLQSKNILGVQIERSGNIVQLVRDISVNLPHIHPPTLLIGIGAFGLILFLRRINKYIPAALISVIAGILIVYIFSLIDQGVNVIGTVPSGLPSFDGSFLNPVDALRVLPLSLAICFISFIESLAVAKSIAAKHGNYPIIANRELLGLGLSKVIGSFFQAFPSTGSFTRSAINDESGAQTGLSSLFTAFFIAIVLVFLTSSLHYVPMAVLGAIIVAAVLGLINIDYVKNLYRLDRKDFYVYMTTFCLTLLLGVQQGVFAGIILSLLMIIYKSSKPHYAVLGRLAGSDSYRNIDRYPEAKTQDDILIIRYDDDLFFGNADHFYDLIVEEIRRQPHTKLLILNASGMSRIDSTALHKFDLLLDHLKRKDIRLIISSLRGPVRDLLSKAGLDQKIGLENYYLSTRDAEESYINGSSGLLSRKYAAQKNKK